jgi:O-acetyl-ADP-ribose deacetylase (regulator of RNase III)
MTIVRVVTLGMLSCAAIASDAHAMSAAEGVAALNAQRAANGIPGDLAVSAGLSDGCAKHMHYLVLNGSELTHDEDPAKPGYTREGAKETAESSGTEVISGGSGWSGVWANPWTDAPLHLLAMFDPTNTEAGWGDEGGLSCMRLTGSRADTRRAGIYTMPGDGVTGVPPVQDSGGEGPYSTADLAGVPDRTGYNILLWRVGAPDEIAAATLTGPRGAVEIRTVDRRTPTPAGGTLWGGAAIVPTTPLADNTRYSATVRYTDGATRAWSFTTGSELGNFGGVPEPGGGSTDLTGGDQSSPVEQAVRASYRGRDRTLRIIADRTPGLRRWGLLTFKDRRGRTISTRRVHVATQRVAVPRAARSFRLTSAATGNYAALTVRGTIRSRLGGGGGVGFAVHRNDPGLGGTLAAAAERTRAGGRLRAGEIVLAGEGLLQRPQEANLIEAMLLHAPGHEGIGIERVGVVEALAHRTPHHREHLHRLRALDALCHGAHPEVAGEIEGRPDDQAIVLVGDDVAHERAVDLQLIAIEVFEMRE